MSLKAAAFPSPLAAWQMALNALIATAPASTAELVSSLQAAAEQAAALRDFSAATPAEVQLVDRLMLLGAAKLVERAEQPPIGRRANRAYLPLHQPIQPASATAATPFAAELGAQHPTAQAPLLSAATPAP